MYYINILFLEGQMTFVGSTVSIETLIKIYTDFMTPQISSTLCASTIILAGKRKEPECNKN